VVLEHLFPENWIEKKITYAFFLAIGYSIIGIVISRLIFGSNSGIVSVFFISLFLLPTMRRLFLIEDTIEEKEIYFSFKHLILDNKDLIKTYFSIFMGIFFTYTFFSFVMPQMGVNSFVIFKEQLLIGQGILGYAFSFSSTTFWDIMINNWWVLVACFGLGLITGDGAIFFITWNASVWGTIFGYRALTASIVATTNPNLVDYSFFNTNPWYFLLIVLVIVIWHVILESGAYILVGTAGGVISREIIKKSEEVRDFIIYFGIGIVILILLNYLFKMVIPSRIFFFIMSALSFIFLLNFLENIFEQKTHKMVFRYNFYLFILGILVFIVGALIETYVLSNSTILNEIYNLSKFINN
jgi:hypothetical protein